jgi:hypothetical protein
MVEDGRERESMKENTLKGSWQQEMQHDNNEFGNERSS